MREEEQPEPEPDQGQESEPLSGIHSHALLMRMSTRAFAFALALATCYLPLACVRATYPVQRRKADGSWSEICPFIRNTLKST